MGLRPAVRRARHLLRLLGMRGLTLHAIAYMRSGLRHVCRRQRFYVYDITLCEDSQLDFPAPRPDCELHFIESHQQADDLVDQGYDDFRSRVPRARLNLSLGAIAVCAYARRTFASIDWMATSPENLHGFAREALRNSLVDRHACTTDAYTVPEFRNAGIGSYRLAGILRYLRDRGYTVCHSVIGVYNAPSRRCVERFGGRAVQVGDYRVTLGLHSWLPNRIDGPVAPVTSP